MVILNLYLLLKLLILSLPIYLKLTNYIYHETIKRTCKYMIKQKIYLASNLLTGNTSQLG